MNAYSHLPLNKYGNNVYSQNGEDGILAYILDCLKIENECSWCVEFGAWDGKHLSNTFNLVTKGWNSVYIEGDSQRFNDLLETTKSHPKREMFEGLSVAHTSENLRTPPPRNV